MDNRLISEKPIFFVAGMHRSGTSLTAMWLKECGFNFGETLLGSHKTNKYGHFEDIPLLYLSQKILGQRNLNNTGLQISSFKLELTDTEKGELKDIIAEKLKAKDHFIWKEPRWTLFLISLKKIFPTLKVIAVFRSPSAVANSLYRREIKRWPFPKFNPWNMVKWIVKYKIKKKEILEKHYNDWVIYNEQILKYKKEFPEDIIIIDVESLAKAKDPNSIMQQIGNFTKLDLKNTSFFEVFDKREFEIKELQMSMIWKKAEAVFIALKNQAVKIS